ncbi:alpha/beta hydrolase [Pseudomarimonas salicorniae]|uniref:Alpha/beta hydrolase n=1 Tax=Pseudomarimonas salicorniae TaxID=2933270 RepID=A0ABT0GD44_9GAMM|nr:alpha/beta hydrolase [Lysobacter sp. CAU 1642]MCK7592460.1 alpha/beta hydrolase [Lysobacter sp. CAU 1642]
MRSIPIVLLAASLLSGPAGATPVAAARVSLEPGQRAYGQIRFEPCSLQAPGMPVAVEAQCGTLEVAENREDPESRRITLGIGWIPVDGIADPDPVFMLAGGPGQAAKQAYPMVHAAFRDVRRSRHIILVDARGTGDSQPLVCRDSEGRANLTEGTSEDLDTARDFARRCAETLGREADLRFYSTGEHIDDLDEVRRALGVARINLVGISYGTRVAQQYAKRYPEATRSVVLDSVVPNSLVLGADHAANLQQALDTHFERCREDAGCSANIGNPRELLDQVSQTLREGDIAPVSYRDARSGEWKEATPEFGHLAILLRMYAYSPETATTLPYLLEQAAGGRYAAMLAQAEAITGSLTEQIYHGMQLSVSCTEDADELRADPAQDASVLGNQLVEFTQAQCAVWPRGSRDPVFREPLTGDLPVLLLSGEFDPVTPPRYGDEVAESLDRARHLVLPGQGHSVLGLGCAPKLLAQFIEKADPAALDAACLERLKPLPPFAGPYGWEP